MHLKAEINWHRLFHELIDDFDAEALARRQKDVLIRAGVPRGETTMKRLAKPAGR